MQKSSFRVTVDGWVAGAYREAGDIVELTVEGAKYENVAPVAAPDKPATKRGNRKAAA